MSYRKHLMTSDEPPSELYKAVELSANLAEVGTDCISRQAAIDICRAPHMRNADCSDFEMAIMKLPPAQPKMGKWIYHIDDLFPAESTMECNQCHAEQPLTCDDEFCPHCGADMRGVTT